MSSAELVPESRADTVANTKRVLLLLAGGIGLLVVAFAVLLGWNPLDRSEARAREAINVAVEACGTHNEIIFDEKLVDAKAAISRVPPDKYFELDSVLYNHLHDAGCKAD